MRDWMTRTGLLLATVVAAGTLAGTAAAQEAPATGAPASTLTGRVDAELDAVRAELLWDAETARAWVGDTVAPEAYAGVLKGARGAFLTGAANSADQALLLATLLDDAAIPLRFATCVLAPATPAAGAPEGTAPDWALLIDEVDEIAVAVTDPELKDAMLALPALRAEHRATSDEAASELALALGAVERPVSPGTEIAAPAAVEHVWLQAARGTAWVDLDTTTPTGDAPCTAEATWDRLPEAMQHRVHISLQVEQRIGGTLSRSERLAVERPMADLATARIAFGFAEPLGILARGPEAVGAPRPYTPVLDIDNELITGAPIMAPRPEGAATGDPGDVIVGIGEDLFGSPDPGASPAETDPVTGAWLAIELIDPQGGTVRLESEVFDRIGIAARVDGTADDAPIEALEQLDGDHAVLGALWQIGLLTGATWAGVGLADASLDPGTVDGLSAQLDALLRLFPAVRADLGGSPAGPAVVLAGLVPGRTPQGAPGMRIVLDALHVPGATPADAAAAARDAQAVIGAEAMLIELLGPLSEGLDDARSVFAATRATGTPWLALAPGDTPAIASASARALARIGQRLDAGFRILTPAAAPSLDGRSATAWWVVDPATGVVRDEHEDGRHSMVEYEANTGRALSKRERFRRFACKLVGPLIVAASLVYGIAGADEMGRALKQVAKAGQQANEQRKRGKAARDIACMGSGTKGPPLP